MLKWLKGRTKVEIDHWELNVTNYENLNVELLKHILSEAEKAVDETVDSYELITARSYTLLSIFISIVGILIAFLVSNIGSLTYFSDRAILSIVFLSILISVYCIVNLIHLVFPSPRMKKGDPPKPTNFNRIALEPKNKQLFNYIFQSIQSSQNKIDFNEHLIQERLILFEKTLKVGVICLVIAITLILLILILA